MSNWMSKLTSEFGDIADSVLPMNTSTIQLPSPSLNWALGNGGLVSGKSICLYGPESSGKSLLSLIMMAQIQKNDPEAICILFSTEYIFSKEWFVKLGGDPKRLIIRKSNDPVKIFDYIYGEMYQHLQDGAPIKCISIDSVKNIIFPKDARKKVSTDMIQGGSGAAYLGTVLKLITPVINDFGVTTILVQQVYEELDSYKKLKNPYIVPDGRALKHFCDYMLEVTKIENKDSIMQGGKNIVGSEQQIGHKVRVKVKKNRTAAPNRVAEFSLQYTKGIVNTGEEVFELAKSLGVIYHPISASTGKPSPLMWQVLDQGIKGEDNARVLVASDINIQNQLIEQCYDVDEDAINNMNESVEASTGIVNFNLDDSTEVDLDSL